MTPAVTRLQITPIKGIGLQQVAEVTLCRSGAAGDRRFFLIDERDRTVNAKVCGELLRVSGEYAEEEGAVLALRMPDGEVLRAPVEVDLSSPERPYGDFRMGRLVSGPWAAALSDLCGRPLRLVMTESAVDRGTKGAVSLVSRGSLRRLSEQARVDTQLSVDDVDGRRFRMLIEVDGVPPHAEDAWVGRELAVGNAAVRLEGHVGRCMVTTRDPDTGAVTLPTLDLLRSYRAELGSTEPLPFGVYGRVLEGGRVRVGDPVTVG